MSKGEFIQPALGRQEEEGKRRQSLLDASWGAGASRGVLEKLIDCLRIWGNIRIRGGGGGVLLLIQSLVAEMGQDPIVVVYCPAEGLHLSLGHYVSMGEVRTGKRG